MISAANDRIGRLRRWLRRLRYLAFVGVLRILRLVVGRDSPTCVRPFPAPVTVEGWSNLVGRVNWHLRGSGVTLVREKGSPVVAPDKAPHIDPDLISQRDVGDVGKGRLCEMVVTECSARVLLRVVLSGSPGTLVDPECYAGRDVFNYLILRRRLVGHQPSMNRDQREMLLSNRVPDGTALVLGTGPSAQEIDPSQVNADIRIVCNSAVRDLELIRTLQPTVVAFADPVFHFGPSRYAAAFRRDVVRCAEVTDAFFVVSEDHRELLLAHHPELRDRTVGLVGSERTWRWPSRTILRFGQRTTS